MIKKTISCYCSSSSLLFANPQSANTTVYTTSYYREKEGCREREGRQQFAFVYSDSITRWVVFLMCLKLFSTYTWLSECIFLVNIDVRFLELVIIFIQVRKLFFNNIASKYFKNRQQICRKYLIKGTVLRDRFQKC